MSEYFDHEARRAEEQRSAGDDVESRTAGEPQEQAPPTNEHEPAPEPPYGEPSPSPRYGEPSPPSSLYGEPPPAAPEAPWRTTEEPGWPYRPQPEEPPPPPEKHGLNPLVRLGVPQPWRGIIDWVVTIAGAILIVLAIKAWIVNPYRIPSSSMEPTLHCARGGAGSSGCEARFSDRVPANRFIYHFRDPHRGEIVVFNVPKAAEAACGSGGVFVKRIIGLPGEVWQERNGYVYIDGKRLSEPYIKPDRRDFQSYPARKIAKGNYFMMGDNRESSCDSRRWGTVPRKSIIGKVFAIYWPPQRIRLM